MRFDRKFSRRAVLKAMGAATAMSPLVPLLNVSGQEATIPKRLLLWFTPHGTIYDAWRPSGSGAQFTLGPILKPLEPHQKKIVVLGNMQMHGAYHPYARDKFPHTAGLPLLWTGGSIVIGSGQFTRQNKDDIAFQYDWNKGPSVDQLIVQKSALQTPYKSLELGVQCGGARPSSRMIYRGPSDWLNPSTNPSDVLNAIFANVGAPSTGVPDAGVPFEKQSVIDVLKADVDALSKKVSSADRGKLEAHLTALRDMERAARPNQPPTQSCQKPSFSTVDPNDIASRPALVDRHSAIIAAAFACDLTRVASFQFTVGDNDNQPYPFLNIPENHHNTLSHDEGTYRQKRIDIGRWYAERFAALLTRLDSIPEGTGTVLDHTMVVWGSEVAKGNHAFSEMPFVVAGGGAFGVRTGNYLQTGGAYHNRLLVSMCQYMGVSPTGNRVGDVDPGTGPLAGLLA